MKAKWMTAVMLVAFSGTLAMGSVVNAAPNRGFSGSPMDQNTRTNTHPTQLDFNKLDRDHDGRISQKEAAAVPTLVDRFQRLDNNADGKLEKGEFSRFEAMEQGKQMKQMQQQDENVNPGHQLP